MSFAILTGIFFDTLGKSSAIDLKDLEFFFLNSCKRVFDICDLVSSEIKYVFDFHNFLYALIPKFLFAIFCIVDIGTTLFKSLQICFNDLGLCFLASFVQYFNYLLFNIIRYP